MSVTRRHLLLAAAAAAGAACASRKKGELAEVITTADETFAPQLLSGFHPAEEGWRWTESQFAVTLKPPRQAARGAVLVLQYSLPAPALERIKQTLITATVEGIPLPPETVSETGRREMRREVPSDVLVGKSAVTARFTVSPHLEPTAADRRQLGVIVHSIGLVKK